MAFTYFFRDIQTLEMVRDHALPVMRSHKYINIWDAGCANGPEPYTLAIVLRENMGQFLFRNVSIFATDIDESNLFGDVINDGIYTMQELERIPNTFSIGTSSLTSSQDTSSSPVRSGKPFTSCSTTCSRLSPSGRNWG